MRPDNVIRFLFLILFTCLLTVAAGAGALPSGLRLDGGFIQYQDWMLKLDAPTWRRELDAMRHARLNLVVIQWLKEDRTEFIPADAQATDPTEVILNDADRHGMQVFVGLTMDADWWNRWLDADYLDRTATASLEIAKRAWKRYGAHPSFAGWYIPQETWDVAYSESQIDHLRSFFQRVSAGCKALSNGKPVAIAPFFGRNNPPNVVSQVYRKLLKGAGIDILILQDGVGANGWGNDVAGNTVPYFHAFRDACVANGVQFWSDLECFTKSHKQGQAFAPTDAVRLGRQLMAESPFVSRFVTFDFFHYMSPYRGAVQKSLYDRYVETFVDRAFLPTFGRSMEIDPQFPYYQGRSQRSIASEIRANGYDIVHYILTADSNVDPALITAMQEEKIGVWYATFANGTYSTKDLPPGWQSWKMVTRSDLAGKPLNDGYTRLCLNNPHYRAWKKRQIGRILRSHPFQGIDIMEPHWPEYPGPESPDYACFCPSCRAVFHRMFPTERALPDILHPQSPQSPARNPVLWRKWLTFRQASLTGFLNDLVNGPGGIRSTNPQAKVCTWMLALTGPNGVRHVREDSGEDAAEIARLVRPDTLGLQTHWPDWTRAYLPPDYVKDYSAYIAAARAASPSIPLLIQADIGSQQQNRRSRGWIETFERTCAALGVECTTCYEYFIGEALYTDPPQIAGVRREGGTIELTFTKRLDPNSASVTGHYDLHPGRVTAVRVDGNRVVLSTVSAATAERLALTLREIADAADKRLYHDRSPTVIEPQTIEIP